MLTELGVVLCLDLASLVFAGLIARQILGRGAASTAARRLVGAATRASDSFLWRELRLLALGSALLILAATGLYGALLLRHAGGVHLSDLAWTALALLTGALLAAVVAYVTARMGLGASSRAQRAAQVSLDRGVAVSLQSAGVAALTTDALATGAVALFLGLLFLLGGGGAGGAEKTSEQTALLLERVANTLPGLAIGAIAGALVLGLGGAGYHVSSKAAVLAAGGLDATDPRNPSMVADLVGEHAGLGARRAVDAFAAGTLANVALVVLGAAAFRAEAESLGSRAWGLVTLPLVARATGLIATAFGLMTARVREAERASHAVWRGHIAASLLVIGGLSGAATWLFGPPYWTWLAGAGALGVAAGAVVGHAARARLDRRLRPLQDVLEALRADPSVATARGIGHGLRGGVLPVAAVLGCLVGAFHLGHLSGIPSARMLGPATALAGLLSTSSYVLSMGLLGPIAAGGLAVAALDPDAARSDVRRRVALLDDAGFEAGAVSDAFFAVVGCTAALLAGLGIAFAAPQSPSLLGLNPLSVGSGIIGSAVVLSLAGRSLDTGARSARGVVLEMERQLRGFPREGGVVQVPEGYTPSYRALIDITGRLSTDGLVPAMLVGLLAPAVLGIVLWLLYRSADLAREGVAAFVVMASATGLGAALACDGARTVLEAARRESRPRSASTAFEASLGAQSVGGFLGHLVSPATHLFVKALAATTLLVTPLLAQL